MNRSLVHFFLIGFAFSFCAKSFAERRAGELLNVNPANKIPPVSTIFYVDDDGIRDEKLGETTKEDPDQELESVEECHERCTEESGLEIRHFNCNQFPDPITYSICMAREKQRNNRCHRECEGNEIPENIPPYQPPHF